MRDPVKTAMEKEQTRKRERDTRTIASRRIWTLEKSFCRTRYLRTRILVCDELGASTIF